MLIVFEGFPLDSAWLPDTAPLANGTPPSGGTSDSFDVVPGSSGRLNFFWEPMAAGKGGAENMAATVLIRVIQDCICSAFLQHSRRTQK